MTDPSRERSLLTTTLVVALLPPDVPEGHMLRAWLDTWSGVGHVLDAMTRPTTTWSCANPSSAGGSSSTARPCSTRARRGRASGQMWRRGGRCSWVRWTC
jgi:hypothetical protein